MPTHAETLGAPEFDAARYLDMLLRRRWVIVAVAAVSLAATVVYTFTRRPVYQASALLVIEKERGAPHLQGAASIESANEDYYQTQYRLLQSRTLVEKVYQDLRLEQYPDFAQPGGVKKLQEALTISPVTRSRLVYVRVNSRDAGLAARAANRISEAFVDQNLANQLFISKEVLHALQVKGDRRSYEALPAVVNNPLIQSLKGEHAKLQSQYAELAQRYTEKHPSLAQVKSNMSALSSQIAAETDRIVQSLKTELSGQLKGNNVRIVDPAIVPERPVWPRRRVNLLVGLLAGVLFGTACALIVEMLDQSIRTQEDVESRLGLPFLGVLPQAVLGGTGKVYDALASEEISLTSEAFRNARTMVDLAGVDGASSSLIVSSTVQGEGKTYVASNLAVAFAQLGQRVLLIDGDLRRPAVHKCMGVSSQKGLSDFLVGGSTRQDFESLVHDTEIPGLRVLPCGPRPPNPSELLNTPRLGALVSWARESYDRVLIDCTPMFPINDTLLWTRHVPHAVFVVRYGLTRVPLILNAAQKLRSGGAKILGVAVNAATPGGLAYSAYGYYYQQYYHSYHQEAPTGRAS